MKEFNETIVMILLACLVSIRCTYMELTDEQLIDVLAAIKYYMQRNISIKNPRYNEYEVILQILTKSIQPK